MENDGLFGRVYWAGLYLIVRVVTDHKLILLAVFKNRLQTSGNIHMEILEGMDYC